MDVVSLPKDGWGYTFSLVHMGPRRGRIQLQPVQIKEGWGSSPLENPRTEWKFLARKIMDFYGHHYGPFSMIFQLCLMTLEGTGKDVVVSKKWSFLLMIPFNQSSTSSLPGLISCSSWKSSSWLARRWRSKVRLFMGKAAYKKAMFSKDLYVFSIGKVGAFRALL